MKRPPLWQLSISTNPEAEDAVAALLENVLAQPASSYTDNESGATTVSVYLENPPAHAVKLQPRIRHELKQLAGFGIPVERARISLRRIRREDWAESWKRHFKPIEVSRSLLIKPSWSKRTARPGQAAIILDPGLSFGTGQHPTTSFCLGQIARFHATDSRKSFLDIGTGSGILAIAAAKLGFAPVDAFDFDPESVRIAESNARRNHVRQKIHLQRADVTRLSARPKRQYDLVCANLISNLLIGERDRIVARVKPGGLLVLAGILNSEFSEIERAFNAAGMKLVSVKTEKEWRSGAFVRATRD